MITTRRLFLDIDGVLLLPTTPECTYRKKPTSARLLYDGLSRDKVELLAQALEPFPDIQIVISSAWREIMPWQMIGEVLNFVGLGVPVVGATEKLYPQVPTSRVAYAPDGRPWGMVGRGLEISKYLTSNDNCSEYTTSVCIIDDDADMGKLTKCLVHTNTYEGLAVRHTPRIRQMLDTPLLSFCA